MKGFIEIDPQEFAAAPFRAVGNDWLLINVCSGSKINSMTASWGGFGVLWSRPALFVFIKDPRYTKELIDQTERFSVSLLDPKKYRKAQEYLGTASGRKEDKAAGSGLHFLTEKGIPYIAEAECNFLLRKLAAQRLEHSGIWDREIIQRFYPAGDAHTLYVGEILKIYKKSHAD